MELVASNLELRDGSVLAITFAYIYTTDGFLNYDHAWQPIKKISNVLHCTINGASDRCNYYADLNSTPHYLFGTTAV